MSFDYADLASDAAELIAEFGRGLTIRAVNRAGGTDWQPITSIVDARVTGIVRDYTESEKAGGIIPAGDQLVIIASGLTPTTAHKVVDDGIEMEIVSIKTVRPGDTAIVHFLQVRR